MQRETNEGGRTQLIVSLLLPFPAYAKWPLPQSRDTVMKLWEPVIRMAKEPKSLSESRYGMGWAVLPRAHEHGFGRNQG